MMGPTFSGVGKGRFAASTALDSPDALSSDVAATSVVAIVGMTAVASKRTRDECATDRIGLDAIRVTLLEEELLDIV